MVTKGLDFEHVTLVAVFDVDRLMFFPDFRSFERTFQVLTQVAGRAGRHSAPGTVLIQTSNPGHPLLRQVLDQDYKAFYESELTERLTYHYPPFMRLIKVTLRHPEREALQEPAEWLALRLKQSLSDPAVLGPQPPPVERIRSHYLTELHLKHPREGTDLPYAKRLLQEALSQMPKFKGANELRVVVDVDPV
jgi:primosomal protein N' (replication factor Y)